MLRFATCSATTSTVQFGVSVSNKVISSGGRYVPAGDHRALPAYGKRSASVLQAGSSLVQPISMAVKKNMDVVIRHEKC